MGGQHAYVHGRYLNTKKGYLNSDISSFFHAWLCNCRSFALLLLACTKMTIRLHQDPRSTWYKRKQRAQRQETWLLVLTPPALSATAWGMVTPPLSWWAHHWNGQYGLCMAGLVWISSGASASECATILSASACCPQLISGELSRSGWWIT